MVRVNLLRIGKSFTENVSVNRQFDFIEEGCNDRWLVVTQGYCTVSSFSSALTEFMVKIKFLREEY